MSFQGENRNKRQGDDKQTEEQRWTDFDRCIGDDFPVLGAFKLLVQVFLVPRFYVFMGILDHHNRSIDHGPDCDRNSPQGHDVGVDPLPLHDDECDQDTHWQRDNCYQR